MSSVYSGGVFDGYGENGDMVSRHEHRSGFVTVESGAQLWMACVVCHN